MKYAVNKWKGKEKYDIINHVSNFGTLVQFMDTWGSVSHACAVSYVWIFVTNYNNIATVNLNIIYNIFVVILVISEY